MEIIVLSALEKVFSDERPKAKQIKSFSMLKNERYSFQTAVYSEKSAKIKVQSDGELSDCTSFYFVKEVPVGLACFDRADDYYIKKSSGNYPDVLVPLDGEFEIEGGMWHSVWVEVKPEGRICGSSELSISFSSNGEPCGKATVYAEVIDALLPEQETVSTCWYHSDCLCNYYNMEAFGDDYWRINRNFIKTAVEHGINCILTPLFTPPLDTRIGGERKTIQLVGVYKKGKNYRFDFSQLQRWVDMCLECGVKYFEMSHLFTQWGAKHAPKIVAFDKKGREKKIFGWSTRTSSRKYDDFLRLFARELIKFIDENSLREKVYFHVSDEPGKDSLKTYKKRAALIAEIFPGFTVIDALSDFDFYSTGAVRLPIPCENKIEDFRGKVPELWTYYCCGQGSEYMPNRFMAMPSLRNRVLGTLMYKYDIKGFLQWGYNFYNTQYSVKAIDPYCVTDAGGAFPSGDSFVVYPGENGDAVASLRLKVFFDGIQDMLALKLLENKIGREKTLELVENEAGMPISFSEYPHSEEWLLNMREAINSLITYDKMSPASKAVGSVFQSVGIQSPAD